MKYVSAIKVFLYLSMANCTHASVLGKVLSFSIIIFILSLSPPNLLMAKDRSFSKIDLFSSMQKGDKGAVLMVYFGTTHADTRAKTISALSNKAKQIFDVDVKEAWTSRIVMRKLKERTGEIILNPSQMLAKLKEDAYTHILVQAVTIIDGVEMEALNKECENFKKDFKDIRIADPLLYSTNDVNTVAKIIGNKYASNKEQAVIFVGHGTYTPATACYSMLEYVLNSQNFNNAFVGTIEGHPSLEDVENRVSNYFKPKPKQKPKAKAKTKQITLVPLMFVAGEHAKNDISNTWKHYFTSKGYKVKVIEAGLGELPQIQNLFIEHAKFMQANKAISILEKKEIYSKQKRHEQN